MLPLLLLAIAQRPCQLFQPVKCDSAVVEVGKDEGFGYDPIFLVIPHQTGYFMVLRVQGDEVAALYPENPTKQYPVQAGDTVRVEDDSWDYLSRKPAGMVILWSPQPIQHAYYQFANMWSDYRLQKRWQMVARMTVGTLREHLVVLGQELAGSLETVAVVEGLTPRPRLQPMVDRIGTGNPYPQTSGGPVFPVFGYDPVTNMYDRVTWVPAKGPY